MDSPENIGKQHPAAKPEPFVDAIEVGRFLHLRPRRVLEMARQGVIPAYPLGQGKRRVWRFRLSELVSAIRSHAVNSAGQSPAQRQETS